MQEEEPLTARPRGLLNEFDVYARHEEGLSLEPEEMGRQFLGDATEQGDFEPVPREIDEELAIDAGTRTDEAMVGPNFEVGDDVWENTINELLQDGGEAGAQRDLEPPPASVELEMELTDEAYGFADRNEPEHDEIDLTKDGVHEASLLDHEGTELGEAVSPDSHTDDTHTHAKHPSGSRHM